MRLLLVAPSTSYRVGAFLDAAEAMGCEVVVATDAPSAIPGSSLTAVFDDDDGERAAADLLAVAGPLDAVVGTDGTALAVAAAVARRLGLPANSPEAMAAAADKLLQRRAADHAGVPQPRFATLDGDGDWSSFPAVVKPADRTASQGVLRVDSTAALVEARAAVATIAPGSALLVESFVGGTEVAVEGLVHDGRLEVLAVFDKPDTPHGPTFPETLLVAPARLDPMAEARLLAVAQAAVSAVGLVTGPVHVEAKVDGVDVWFLELAARTIGGRCSRSLDRGGVSLERRVLAQALGLPSPSVEAAPSATGVVMLPVPISGRVTSVRGLEAAQAVAGVTEVSMSVRPGQPVTALPAGGQYLGFVFARADTADEVEAALRAAWAALEIDITAW